MYSQYNTPPQHGAPVLGYQPINNQPPNIYQYGPPSTSYAPPLPQQYQSPTPSGTWGAQPVQQAQYGNHAGPSRAPSIAQPPQHSNVMAIPAPVLRTEYQPPVFKTFQQRKREREAALAATAGTSSATSSPVKQQTWTPAPPPQAPVQPIYQSSPVQPTLPPRMVRPIPPSPSGPLSATAPVPPASALAMMAKPNTAGRPLPPPRAGSQSQAGPSQPPQRSTSPAPPPRPQSPATSVLSERKTSPAPPPTAPRIAATAPSSVASNRPLLPRGPALTSAPPPLPSGVQALLDRSDTISSVKSLDRADFGAGRRALPKPPVTVAASKSLDRGALPSDPRRVPRRGTVSPSPICSPVLEEGPEELAARMAGVTVGGIVPVTSRSPPTCTASPVTPRSPVTPTINLPSIGITSPDLPSIKLNDSPPQINAPLINVNDKPPVPTISAPSISVSPPVPTINIGEDSPSRPASPGISFSAAPTIAVSSGDTRDPPSISIPVPGVRGPTPRRAPPSAAPTRINATSAILCAGCTNPIIGRIVSAMNQRWHPQCFRCDICGELLEHVSAYEHDGKPYCHLDYHDRFAHQCHHCRTPIVDARFITLDDELGQRYYHELHFFCSECGDPFLDPSQSSAPGTEFGRSPTNDDAETNAFVIHKGHPYCERCHVRLHKPKCRACKRPIPDVAVTALDAKWHAECFTCANCARPFANNLFFPRNGSAFCTECFEKMN